MSRVVIAAGFALAGISCQQALGADPPVPATTTVAPYWTPSLVLDGSLGLSYTDNALATRNNRIEAEYIVPFLRMTFGLKSADGWSLIVYARGTSESYTERVADNALATVGSTLSKTTDNTTVGMNFDTKFYYDGLFATRGPTAYDLSAFVTHPFSFEQYGLTVVPRFTLGYRWADLAALERASIDAQLSIEKELIKPWSIVAGGRFRVYWFNMPVAGVRPIDMYPSASLGVKYDFGHDVTLTTSVAALVRRSNITTRDYEKIDIGPSVDFKVVF